MNPYVTSLFGTTDTDDETEEEVGTVSRSPFVLNGLPPEVS